MSTRCLRRPRWSNYGRKLKPNSFSTTIKEASNQERPLCTTSVTSGTYSKQNKLGN